MKAMTLREIAAACGGQYFGDESKLDIEVTGVAIDSRKVEEGYLFVPIKGARVDGHDFIPQVMEKGALCTLSERPLSCEGKFFETEEAVRNVTADASVGDVTADEGETDRNNIGMNTNYIFVNSCEQALKDLAEHYRKALDIKVVGITGSVGKTSTKEMIGSVLSQKYNVLKTAGNFNNEIGLPLTIFNIREEHEVAVLEMGISDFGEMSRLAKMARPDICVITNIGLCHLENLGDRDGILRAKTEMFDYAQPNATFILNGDDDKLITVKTWDGLEPKYFGLSSEADAYAEDIRSLSLRGTTCKICMGEASFETTIPIPGHHMVYNALAGAMVGRELGLNCEEIKVGIESLVPVSGRNNLIETDSLLIIDDCYNANPISMKASLDVLATADTRKVAILGDMFELGENEKELHYEVGEHAAEKGIDLIVCIGNLSENIAKGVVDVAKHMLDVVDDENDENDADNQRVNLAIKTVHFASKTEFFEQMKTLLCKGDTILVKASHGMEFPEIVEKLKEINL